LLLELSRGLAALWVFFFHVKSLFENSSPVIYDLSAYGSLGVPMFFVISGYVITYSAESSLKNERSPFIFLKARFLRIYPTFWASVAVVLLSPYIIESISFLKSGEYMLPVNIFTKFNYIEWSNFLLLSKVFWATSHDLQAEFNTINSVYWTLAIEFQFYLVVFLALCFKKYYRYVIAIVSIAALLIMLIPNEINYGFFIHYWPSFSIGIILAYFHRNGVWSNSLLKNKTAQLIASFFVAVLLVDSVTSFGQNRIFFAIYFGVFLWVISDVEKVINKIKNSKNKLFFWLLEPWLILGTMSYSVYLLHSKIYVLPNMFVRQIIEPGNILFGLLTIIGTLLLCYPFFFFVERRFLSKNYKKLQKTTTEVLTKVSKRSS
jgi:peptidoglycan/LPS O-acetylase OafA/YrhL